MIASNLVVNKRLSCGLFRKTSSSVEAASPLANTGRLESSGSVITPETTPEHRRRIRPDEAAEGRAYVKFVALGIKGSGRRSHNLTNSSGHQSFGVHQGALPNNTGTAILAHDWTALNRRMSRRASRQLTPDSWMLYTDRSWFRLSPTRPIGSTPPGSGPTHRRRLPDCARR